MLGVAGEGLTFGEEVDASLEDHNRLVEAQLLEQEGVFGDMDVVRRPNGMDCGPSAYAEPFAQLISRTPNNQPS